jgi:hypothetical protein
MNEDIQIFTETVRYDNDEQYIFVKPLCDFFDIEYENVKKTVQRDEVLQRTSVIKADEFIFGDKRERIALTKPGFIRWVQLLNPDLVRPDLKDKLIHYQTKVTEWIMGNIDEDMKLRKAYKRSNEIDGIIKALKAEKKACDSFVQNYLSGKAYFQMSLPLDQKKLT